MMSVMAFGEFMMIFMICQVLKNLILVYKCSKTYKKLLVLLFSGGKDWLALTKGTDCTEAFETFHVFGVSNSLLEKFWVKKATSPRRYRYHNQIVE